MIYGLLDNKFNTLSGCLQSVARQHPDIVMFNKGTSDQFMDEQIVLQIYQYLRCKT